jgi:predicted transcriptional regulator
MRKKRVDIVKYHINFLILNCFTYKKYIYKTSINNSDKANFVKAINDLCSKGILESELKINNDMIEGVFSLTPKGKKYVSRKIDESKNGKLSFE